MMKNAFTSEYLWYSADKLRKIYLWIVVSNLNGKVYLIRHVNNRDLVKYADAQ